jgi:hypothetical protein
VRDERGEVKERGNLQETHSENLLSSFVPQEERRWMLSVVEEVF